MALTYAKATAMLGHEDNVRALFAVSPQELIDRARGAQTKALQRVYETTPALLPTSALSIAAGYAAADESARPSEGA